MKKQFVFAFVLLVLLSTYKSKKSFSINKFNIETIYIENNLILTNEEIREDLDFLYTRILENNSKYKFSNKKIGKLMIKSSKFWNDQKQKLQNNEIGFLILKNNWLESSMKKEFFCTLSSLE